MCILSLVSTASLRKSAVFFGLQPNCQRWKVNIYGWAVKSWMSLHFNSRTGRLMCMCTYSAWPSWTSLSCSARVTVSCELHWEMKCKTKSPAPFENIPVEAEDRPSVWCQHANSYDNTRCNNEQAEQLSSKTQLTTVRHSVSVLSWFWVFGCALGQYMPLSETY